MATLAACFLHLVIVCFLALSCAAEQNCSEVQCKALPVGENVASEFHLKATEKGVRMVFLNLEIGNDTYHPLELKDEFFPERWVWAQSISEPMLSLPDDYDILSLGLLNFQVRRMTVQLKDEPNGCLAALNSSCQNLVVGRALLVNVTRGSSRELLRKTEVVCVEMIEKDADSGLSSLKYHCCSPDVPSIHCDIPIKSSNWFAAIKTFLIILSIFALLYCPLLPLALPGCIFNLKYERNKEDHTQDELKNSGQAESNASYSRSGYEQIINRNEEEDWLTRPLTSAQVPVDDVSPITCSTLLLGYVRRLPDVRLSFNVKLVVMMFCFLPFVFYVQVGLYLTLKQKYVHELLVKLPPGTLRSDQGFSVNLAAISTPDVLLIFVLWAFTILITILFLRPKDLFLRQGMKGCPVCVLAQLLSIIPETEDLDCPVNIGDKMLLHLKILQQTVYLLMSFFLKLHISGLKKLLNLSACPLLRESNHYVSRITRALCVLWILFSILPALLIGLVLGAICLLLFFVTLVFFLFHCSPFVTLAYSVVMKMREIAASFNKCLYYLTMLFSCSYSGLLFVSYVPVSISCTFVTGMLGFTIMGLVLNTEIVTPYVAFFLVVITNMYLCYANLQSRYKEVKGLILNYRQNELQITNDDQDTIPTKLFWFVCDGVIPIKTEICLMFRNMAVIVTFLFLAVSSIIFFGNTYNISTVVSTIAVFVSGVIPGLFFNGLTKGKNFSGWAKIKIKREIETAVQAFYRERGEERGNSSTNDSAGESSLNRYTVL